MNKADVVRMVHETIVSVLPRMTGRTIPGNQHLRDIGADSIDRVEIVSQLIQRFGLDMPMASFNDVADIGGLVELLFERQCAREGGRNAGRN